MNDSMKIGKSNKNDLINTDNVWLDRMLGVFIGSVIGLFGLFGSFKSVIFLIKLKTEPNQIQIKFN